MQYLPVWLQIVLALGGTAFLGALATFLVTRVVKFIDERRQTRTKLQQEHNENEERKKDRELQKAWMQEVRDIISPIAEDIREIRKELTQDKEATVLNMRVTLKSLRDRFKAQHCADLGDKAMWAELYGQYKAMGGNHFREYVDCWKAEVEALPLEKPVKNIQR